MHRASDGAEVNDTHGASINENVFFTDLSINDPDSWQWDFGDGSWSSVRSPMHSYSAAGTYNVTLTAGNQYTSGSITKKILITEDAPTLADIDFECDPLVNPSIPTTELQCKPIIKNPNVVITSWFWQFIKDGVEVWCSSEKAPFVKINEPGIYDVKLTVGNNGGTLECDGSDPACHLYKPRYVTIGEGNYVLIYPGWNHVSVPVELANGFNTMANIFAGIPTGAWPYSIYDWKLQNWGEVKDDYIVKPLELVRINSVAEPGPNVTTTFVFATLEGSYETLLHKGWNGIGISAWQPTLASDALKSIEGKWDRVIGYDAELQVWEEPIYSKIDANTRFMHPGMGYLILMDEDATFTNSVKL
jgi:hypothetical protein